MGVWKGQIPQSSPNPLSLLMDCWGDVHLPSHSRMKDVERKRLMEDFISISETYFSKEVQELHSFYCTEGRNEEKQVSRLNHNRQSWLCLE